jgi:hypothetical protein
MPIVNSGGITPQRLLAVAAFSAVLIGAAGASADPWQSYGNQSGGYGYGNSRGYGSQTQSANSSTKSSSWLPSLPTFPRARKAVGYAVYPIEWSTRPARRAFSWTADKAMFWRSKPQPKPLTGMTRDDSWHRSRDANPTGNPVSSWFDGADPGSDRAAGGSGFLSQDRPGF